MGALYSEPRTIGALRFRESRFKSGRVYLFLAIIIKIHNEAFDKDSAFH